MGMRIFAHAGIRRRSTQGRQLLGHGPQFGRGNKRLLDPSRARCSRRPAGLRSALLARLGRFRALFAFGRGCRRRSPARSLPRHGRHDHQSSQHAGKPARRERIGIWRSHDPHLFTVCRIRLWAHAGITCVTALCTIKGTEHEQRRRPSTV
jgi:hypothetical protein